jgi:hypothetical protein
MPEHAGRDMRAVLLFDWVEAMEQAAQDRILAELLEPVRCLAEQALDVRSN